MPATPVPPCPERPAGRAHLRRLSGAAALLALALSPVFVQAAATRSADPLAATLIAGPAADARRDDAANSATPAPWWMAFDDATLNLLVHWAQQRQAGLQALQPGTPAQQAEAADDTRRQVVASYVGARVFSARWIALNGVGTAATRQLALLKESPPANAETEAERGALITKLSQRVELVAQQQQALAVQREGLLRLLAGLCGLEAPQLAELLAPTLAQASVPSFGSAVPSKLPRSILRARTDVAAAEAAVLRSLRSAGGRQHELVARMHQAPGWIDPEQAADAGDAPAANRSAALSAADASPELAELNALLANAANEVAQDLRSLSERARLQAERAQLADASRQAFLVARERLKSGELSELQVLEQYQRLLSESDRYASACGELAMAWLRLVASTGASEQVLVRR